MLGTSWVPFKVLSGSTIPGDIIAGLTRGRITSIDVDVGQSSKAGFAEYDDPLSTAFDVADVIFGSMVLFVHRVDSLVVPPATLKAMTRKRVAENLAATRRERMPRVEREELAEQVRNELLKRAVPKMVMTAVAWDFGSATLRLYSTSSTVREDFLHRAQEHLGLELRATDIVGTVATMEPETQEDLYHLLPVSFTFSTEDEEDDDGDE